MSDDAQDLLLGRYRLGRQLGEGGMGAVFEGVQVGLERRVAIKMLLPELVANAELAARFKREAEMVARLNHPHIVQISDFGVHAGKPVMVMEYLEGESLREYLARSAPLSLAQTMAVAAPILRALSAAHAAGVVHRDVKPENIFLVWDEELPIPKLLDFGIAKTDHVERITKTQSTLGTALYMAPEQVRSSKNVGPACDQYAMGVVLYEMLTGEFPHEGETGPQLAVAKLTEEPHPLSAHRTDLPAHIVDAVMRTLELEPQRRFSDVAELRRAMSGDSAAAAGVVDVRAKTMLPQTSGDVDVEGATLPPKTRAPEIQTPEIRTPEIRTPEIKAPVRTGAAATGPTMPAIARPAAPIVAPVIEPQVPEPPSPEPLKPIPRTAPPRAVAAQAVATPLPSQEAHATPAPHLAKMGASKSTQWMRGAVTALLVAGAGGLLVVGLFVALRGEETVVPPVASTPSPVEAPVPDEEPAPAAAPEPDPIPVGEDPPELPTHAEAPVAESHRSRRARRRAPEPAVAVEAPPEARAATSASLTEVQTSIYSRSSARWSVEALHVDRCVGRAHIDAGRTGHVNIRVAGDGSILGVRGPGLPGAFVSCVRAQLSLPWSPPVGGQEGVVTATYRFE